MHCFTESLEVAEASIDMGFCISFSGIVTFKNAQALRDVAKPFRRARCSSKPIRLIWRPCRIAAR
jgi:Tat protein secretion system quality control protein TatD with DNase activity